MNDPVRSGILAFVCDRDAEMLYDVLTELYASYPRPVSDSLMNLIGTHDTERILTVLGSEPGDYDRPNRALSVARLSPEKRRAAAHLLKLASLLQYTVFGIPSLYYGDEVGLEGYHDPFCRMPFAWDELEEPVRADLLAHYRALGALRAPRPESRRVPACRARCRLARLPPLRRARLRRLRQRRGSFDRRQPQFRTG